MVASQRPFLWSLHSDLSLLISHFLWLLFSSPYLFPNRSFGAVVAFQRSRPLPVQHPLVLGAGANPRRGWTFLVLFPHALLLANESQPIHLAAPAPFFLWCWKACQSFRDWTSLPLFSRPSLTNEPHPFFGCAGTLLLIVLEGCFPMPSSHALRRANAHVRRWGHSKLRALRLDFFLPSYMFRVISTCQSYLQCHVSSVRVYLLLREGHVGSYCHHTQQPPTLIVTTPNPPSSP